MQETGLVELENPFILFMIKNFEYESDLIAVLEAVAKTWSTFINNC